jgi:hypothetical protein
VSARTGNGERFHIADGEAIAGGRTTDVYFARALEVLEREGVDPHIVLEVRARSLPDGWPWAMIAGVEEATSLFADSGGPTLRALAEGSLFQAGEPVLVIEGRYRDFATLTDDALQPPPRPYPPVAALRDRARAGLPGRSLQSPLT